MYRYGKKGIMMSIYDFKVKDSNGNIFDMQRCRGKIILIVNTASKCGFTPQFGALEELYRQCHMKGLEIIGFPCNQFASQDPGTNDEIKSFCQLNYGVTFPMMSKIEVNGENEEPLYTFLKNEKSGLLGKAIKWNFTKFLIDREGNVVKRFAPSVQPKDIKKVIEMML